MCREKSLRVAVIDSNLPGGACALRGCDPKKVLVGFAEIIDSINNMKANRLNVGGSVIDMEEDDGVQANLHRFCFPGIGRMASEVLV